MPFVSTVSLRPAGWTRPGLVYLGTVICHFTNEATDCLQEIVQIWHERSECWNEAFTQISFLVFSPSLLLLAFEAAARRPESPDQHNKRWPGGYKADRAWIKWKHPYQRRCLQLMCLHKPMEHVAFFSFPKTPTSVYLWNLVLRVLHCYWDSVFQLHLISRRN